MIHSATTDGGPSTTARPARESKKDDDEDDDIFCGGLDELFIDKDYKLVEYTFGSIRQPLLCSMAASTDYDLTGLIVWPVSVYLAWFVALNPQLFRDKVVLELGAGCGLAGLVASQMAATTVLTDGNDHVLALLEKNAAANCDMDGNSSSKVEEEKVGERVRGKVYAQKLLWGDEDSLQEVLKDLGERVPEVLLGCDIVCWPLYVAPLLQTVKRLLLLIPTDNKGEARGGGALYLGFVCRAQVTRDILLKTASDMGMLVDKLPNPLIPEADRANVASSLELELLRIQLDPTSPLASIPPVMVAPQGVEAPC